LATTSNLLRPLSCVAKIEVRQGGVFALNRHDAVIVRPAAKHVARL